MVTKDIRKCQSAIKRIGIKELPKRKETLCLKRTKSESDINKLRTKGVVAFDILLSII